ncbi:MAG: WG repeat-containing protein [Prevotellaceae bacterium]|nr:WG repeat-containing protein [Prevotellaceae bacterium]
MNDTRMFIDCRCGGLRIWMLLVLSYFVLGVPAQSIADLARKAEERKDPLHAYTNVGDFHYGMAVAQKKLPNGEPGEYWGVVDEEGKVRIAFKYRSLSYEDNLNDEDNLYVCRTDRGYGFVSTSSGEILPTTYSDLTYVDGERWSVRRNGKMGIVKVGEANGSFRVETIVPCEYDQVQAGDGDEYYVVTNGSLHGLLDWDGKTVIACVYDDVDLNKYVGFCSVKRNGLKGLMSRTGEELVPCAFDDCGVIDEHFLWTRKGNTYGIYSSEGEKVQPCKFSSFFIYEGKKKVSLSDFAKLDRRKHPDLYAVVSGKVGTLDSENFTTKLPCAYDYLSDFATRMKITNGVRMEQRLAVCRLNGKYGIVNSEGKQIQPMAFDELRKDVSDPSSKELPDMGSARDLHVRIGDKWGVLTADGEQLAEVKFDSVGVFHDGLAVVKAAERYGYIDRSGAIVIPIQWMAAYDFSEGLAALRVDKKHFQFIDTAGTVVIKSKKYDSVGRFRNGICRVVKGGKVKWIDTKGKELKEDSNSAKEDEGSGANHFWE